MIFLKVSLMVISQPDTCRNLCVTFPSLVFSVSLKVFSQTQCGNTFLALFHTKKWDAVSNTETGWFVIPIPQNLKVIEWMKITRNTDSWLVRRFLNSPTRCGRLIVVEWKNSNHSKYFSTALVHNLFPTMKIKCHLTEPRYDSSFHFAWSSCYQRNHWG